METGGIVNHVGQCVADLDRSVRFYTELLGFEVDRTLELPDAAVTALLSIEPPVGLRAVYLRQGSFQLELMQFDRPGNPGFTQRVFNEPGLTHVSVCVDDLDDARARVADLGGSIETDLGTVVLVRDPDGQLLELLPMSFRSARHTL